MYEGVYGMGRGGRGVGAWDVRGGRGVVYAGARGVRYPVSGVHYLNTPQIRRGRVCWAGGGGPCGVVWIVVLHGATRPRRYTVTCA